MEEPWREHGGNGGQGIGKRGRGHSRMNHESRDRGGPREPSERNEEVILLGLPENSTEAMIEKLLCSVHVNPRSIANITVAQDRQTGLCRGHAFVNFTNLQRAMDFVEANFPSISCDIDFDAASAARRIRIDYSNRTSSYEQSDGTLGGWTCYNCHFENYKKQVYCYKCRGPGPLAASDRPPLPTRPHNDGTRDILSQPSQLVLVRGLRPETTEDTLLRTLHYLSPNAIRRVIVPRDRADLGSTDDDENDEPRSWGFAFVEFRDATCATYAVRDVMDPSRFEIGFRVEDQIVSVSFANGLSFVPVENLYTEEDVNARGPIRSNLRQDEDRQTVVYWDSHACLTERYETRFLEHADGASSIEEEHLKTQWRPLGQSPGTISSDVTLDESTKDKERKKKNIERAASRRMASNINKWNQKSAELSDVLPIAPSKLPKLSKVLRTSTREDLNQPKTITIMPASETFAHPCKAACLLCMRKFRMYETLQRHESESPMHQQNLRQDVCIAKARARLSKVGGNGTTGDINPTTKNPNSLAQYRDRAAERREIYSQPSAPPTVRHEAAANRTETARPPQPVSSQVPLEATNLGNVMLQRMGWSRGEGLGSDGSGRVDPIESTSYHSGAGLGTAKLPPAGTDLREHGRVLARARYATE